MLTGADPYYCAGVNFGDAIRAGNPAKLHKMVKNNNAAIFNAFIQVIQGRYEYFWPDTIHMVERENQRKKERKRVWKATRSRAPP